MILYSAACQHGLLCYLAACTHFGWPIDWSLRWRAYCFFLPPASHCCSCMPAYLLTPDVFSFCMCSHDPLNRPFAFSGPQCCINRICTGGVVFWDRHRLLRNDWTACRREGERPAKAPGGTPPSILRTKAQPRQGRGHGLLLHYVTYRTAKTSRIPLLVVGAHTPPRFLVPCRSLALLDDRPTLPAMPASIPPCVLEAYRRINARVLCVH